MACEFMVLEYVSVTGEKSSFYKEFTEAYIVAALLYADPNNLHTTKVVTTRPGLLPSHVLISCV